MAEIPNTDERDAERPTPFISPEHPNPQAGGQTQPADKRKHTPLEILAVFIGVLAFRAAAGQAYVANDTEKRTLRAYVIVTSVKFERDEAGKFKLGVIMPDSSAELLITYNISNEGSTPAYDVNQGVAIQYPFSGSIDDKEWRTQGVAAYVAKQQSLGPVRTRYFTQEQRDAFLSGRAPPLAFAGQLPYRDIFEHTRHTNFCFMWVGAPVEPAFISCPRYSDLDRLNYAD